MNKNIHRVALIVTLILFVNISCLAQLSPINFEHGGHGASWTWTTFENDSNPAVEIITNPFMGGINSSGNVAKFTALQAGNPWAGFESLHGGGIGTFTLDTTNCIVKVMVYKSVISDVGVKFVTPSSASTGELKVSNTLINQWEELTFDFTRQIGHPAMIGIDQIVIFPDFDLAGRTVDNVCYIDNITLGTNSTPLSLTEFSADDFELTIGKNYFRFNSNSITQFDGLEIFSLLGEKLFQTKEAFYTNKDVAISLKSNEYYIIRARKGTKFFSKSVMIIK